MQAASFPWVYATCAYGHVWRYLNPPWRQLNEIVDRYEVWSASVGGLGRPRWMPGCQTAALLSVDDNGSSRMRQTVSPRLRKVCRGTQVWITAVASAPFFRRFHRCIIVLPTNLPSPTAVLSREHPTALHTQQPPPPANQRPASRPAAETFIQWHVTIPDVNYPSAMSHTETIVFLVFRRRGVSVIQSSTSALLLGWRLFLETTLSVLRSSAAY